MSGDLAVDEHPPYRIKVDGEVVRREVPTLRLALQLSQDLHERDQRLRVQVFNGEHTLVFQAQNLERPLTPPDEGLTGGRQPRAGPKSSSLST